MIQDLHAHTYYSFCSQDKPEKMIETVIAGGVQQLGICDHNYGIGERKKQYLAEIKDLATRYLDKIKIYCGIEIATLPGLYDIENVDEIKDFDYCLIEHITDDDSIVKENHFEFCNKLGILCGVAHTDLFAYCDSLNNLLCVA